MEGEILTPESEPQRVHVNINVNRRSGIPPQLFTIGALVFLSLRFLPAIGIGLVIVVALTFAYPTIAIALGGSLVLVMAVPSDVGSPYCRTSQAYSGSAY
jgi:hypothetical protein